MEITFRNSKINYTVEGKLNHNTVVFLHGFTESLEIWDEFSAELSLDYKVICIDLPGHGRSDCIDNIHTMNLMADCVKEVLNEEKTDNCIVIGHSMGGYVTLAFAEKYSEFMKGLGLFHSSALADTPEGKANRVKTIEVIENNHNKFIMNFIPDLFTPSSRTTLKKEIDILINNAQKMSKQAIIAALRGMMERNDMTHVLKNANYPVLFIAGKQDSRVPFNKILEQIALPKDSFSVLMHDVAHMGYLEASEKTIYSVKCFINGIY